MPVASCVERVHRLEWEQDRAREFTPQAATGVHVGRQQARPALNGKRGMQE
jgi:hypothetical protein